MKQKEIFRFVNIGAAVALQRDLSRLVKYVDDPNFGPRLLCGLDVAYEGETAFVAGAIWDTRARRIVETFKLVDKAATQYVPGFLAFREGPVLMKITPTIRRRPDVFLLDGQGVAHPRGFGLASHVGLALDRPTIGVAKSRLFGRVDGDRITDTDRGLIGKILITEDGKKYYVSVGHRISLDTAFKLVQGCMVDGFPAPLRGAHLDSLLLKRNNVA